jgi:hypothetical protein
LVAWFQEHPKLETSEPEPITLAGAEGFRLEIEAAKPYQHAFCGTSPCVLLWNTLNAGFLLPSDHRLQLTALEVGGETVMVTVEATSDDFDDFAADASAMLETLSLG